MAFAGSNASVILVGTAKRRPRIRRDWLTELLGVVARGVKCSGNAEQHTRAKRTQPHFSKVANSAGPTMPDSGAPQHTGAASDAGVQNQ